MLEKDELYIYYNFLFGYVFSISKNKELAEDIVQDTFVKAMENIHKFKGECKVETWLCKIAKNLYISYVRKKDNQEKPELIEKASEDNFIEHLMDKENAKYVMKALHQIPEPYKEVFFLHVFGEMSLVEIGELFEKSISWASVTFYRAKKKIREKMKEDGYEYNIL